MSWRAILNVITVFVFAAVFVIWNYPALWTPAPCEEPITYTIGTFDRRFNVSQKDFLHALTLAETIWEKPLGKELFVYNPEKSELAVNLIYDYRQETTKTLSGLENKVEQEEETYEALEARYANLKAEYNNTKEIYDARVRTFDDMNNEYQRQVESWNRSKRTSKVQFEKLETARVLLETEMTDLKVIEAKLNEIVREINSLVGTLNGLAKSLNLKVETYNTIGAARGESFTGGIYHSADGEQDIDIYEFSSQEKLVRIMAHELGHALGLEHIDDSQAIMYYLNEGDAEILTQADLVALKMLCGTE